MLSIKKDQWAIQEIKNPCRKAIIESLKYQPAYYKKMNIGLDKNEIMEIVNVNPEIIFYIDADDEILKQAIKIKPQIIHEDIFNKKYKLNNELIYFAIDHSSDEKIHILNLRDYTFSMNKTKVNKKCFQLYTINQNWKYIFILEDIKITPNEFRKVYIAQTLLKGKDNEA